VQYVLDGDFVPPLKILYVIPTSETTIEVYFSHPIEPETITDNANFNILNTENHALEVVQVAFKAGSMSQLVITTGIQQSGELYELTVRNLQPIHNIAISDEGMSKSFSGFPASSFNVIDVIATSMTTVKIIFSNPVEEIWADNLSIFQITDQLDATVVDIYSVILTEGNRVVVLTTSQQKSNSPYTLDFTNISDQFNQTLSDSIVYISFASDSFPPELLYVRNVPGAVNEIEFVYSEPINPLSTKDVGHFKVCEDASLSTCFMILAAELNSEQDRVTVTIDGTLDSYQEYFAYTSDIEDLSYNVITPEDTSFMSGYYNPPVMLSPSHEAVVTSEMVTLSWGSLPQVNSYTLMVALDSDFTNIVIDTELDSSTTTFEFLPTEFNPHYWKVYADYTIYEPTPKVFTPLDAVYIWGDSAELEEAGTMSQPYKTINGGLSIWRHWVYIQSRLVLLQVNISKVF